MKYNYILLLLFLLPGFLFSQKADEVLNRKFDSIFFDAATNIASTDIDRAHKIADSLYRFSHSDAHKIRKGFDAFVYVLPDFRKL